MHVSCRATRVLLESLEASGIDPRKIPGDHSRLRDPRQRITWDEFARLLDVVAEVVGSDEALERIGERFAAVPSFTGPHRVSVLLASPRQVFWFFARFVGPSLFPTIAARLDDLPDGRVALTLELPPDARPSRPLFQICKGGIRAMPRVLGLPHAELEMEGDDRFARYVVRLPERAPFFRRLQRAIGSFGVGGDALAELERYREDLQESYDALVRSKRDFRDLLERMPDAVMVHREGRILWGNQAFVRHLGRTTLDDLTGANLVEDLVHPDDRAEMLAVLARGGLAPDATMRVRMRRADGELVDIELSAPQTVELDGAPARLVVGRDVTERTRQEAAMVLADRMASLGLLAAGVAHEINNPLAYVHANLVIADRELQRAGGGARLSEAIAAARDGTERVRSIVRDLKMLSRGESEHLEPVDPRGVVEAAVTLARKAIESRARLRLILDDVPTVRADRARLGQVMLNLLLNAAEAIPEGEAERHEIVVTISQSDQQVVLEVRDTGAGIAPEHLPRLFDPFFTTKGPGQGTGLGLSICHRIVTGLGGRIEVESSPGSGSRFRVRLPAEPVLEPVPSSAPPRREASARRARVLLVDDEPRLLRVLSSVLAETHDVTAASSGTEALGLLRDREFDVIVCDLMMADTSGMQLSQALAVERPGMEKRMIFMTGGTFTPAAREFLAQTSQRCLEKPFELDRLLDAVQERLR